ncbi:unnamed protein product [Paramecium primaurelia]|uniref:Transmembrane protein n=1 Tax=Paramecium primaurelia TaxID=5886 RepID=A0A8S1KDA5_PARPR|nr:unnamed protein product [Paramecium primaurelia]
MIRFGSPFNLIRIALFNLQIQLIQIRFIFLYFYQTYIYNHIKCLYKMIQLNKIILANNTMGLILCHNIHSKNKKLSFVHDHAEQLNRQSQRQQLDLPYRHYISKSNYIASALPHAPCKFNLKKGVMLAQGIGHSSIMQRRFLEKLNLNSSYFHSQALIIVNPQ